MKRLILIRHAKAVPAEKTSVTDFDRNLTPRGRRDAEQVGQWLRNAVPALERIIASPSNRTRQTAELIASAWGSNQPVIEYNRALYLPTCDELLEVIWALDPAVNTVALVGHNPSISELLEELTGITHQPMPTCAVAVLAPETDSWIQLQHARCRLEHYRTPADE